MNYKRIGRMTLCLLMICALLVNISPIRAEAAGLGTTVAVAAVSVAASMLIGAGISTGTDTIAHSELAQDAVTALQAAGVVLTNGLMDVVSLGSGLFGVKSDTVQSLFDWLHADSGAVSDPFSSLSSQLRNDIQSILNERASAWGVSTVYALYEYSLTHGWVQFNVAKYPFVLGSDGKYRSYDPSGSAQYPYYCWFTDNGFGMRGSSASNYCYLIYGDSVAYTGTNLGFDCIISDGLTANFIANPGMSLADGYPLWAANSVTIPNAETGEEETYYPIALGNSLEETQSFTQEQVWVGEGTYVDTGSGSITVPEEVTLKDILTGILSIPQSFAGWFQDVISWGKSIWEAVIAIPQAIATAIADVLAWAFAPSETFIQSKVEALIAKYPTADTFSNLGNSLNAFFGGLGATPPIIYIDLGAFEGSYFLGGREVFLDLTWYSRYKPTVDSIIGAFIWLWLAWRVFLSIPSIIHGEAGSWGDRKTDIGASNTSGAIIVHQRELPSGKK